MSQSPGQSNSNRGEMVASGRKLLHNSSALKDNSSRRGTKILSRLAANIILILFSTLSLSELAAAQKCIPLSGSNMCSAFPDASISVTDKSVVDLFPFLNSVTDTASFDRQLKTHVSTSFVQQKYQQLLGCRGIDLSNTSFIYARFTTTVICNAIIQNSRDACALSTTAARPICAETCAQQAESESMITANRDLCPAPNHNSEAQIRADFTNCALPDSSLTSACISGAVNEPDNCGFRDNTVGLCQYCASGGINSTDTCCYNAGAQNRCANVVLPTITGFITFSTSLPTETATHPNALATVLPSNVGGSKLPPGTIAGITIGSILMLAVLGGIVFLFMLCVQRRRNARDSGMFNQPLPPEFNHIPINNAKKGHTSMAITPVTTTAGGYEILPGGRIARMSALESHTNPASERNLSTTNLGLSKRRELENSSSDESMLFDSQGKVIRPPPTGRRAGSLSSNSILGIDVPQSPNSASIGGNSSPLAPASHQSEQLLYFKDYYSADEIHPGDKVAVLWAYQPRAGDEFALERGDMLKVAGIWDDGWATGVMINERADEWDLKHNIQRDSGVSNTSIGRNNLANVSSEIKAFPLVCVCLPEHWRKTIDGDETTEASLQGSESAT